VYNTQTLSNFTRWCVERGVGALTAYAFSTENWRRDPAEVNALMHIFCRHAETMREEAQAWGVRVRVLCSDSARIPPHVTARLRALEEATAGNGKFTLNLCISYGARGEIVNACKRCVCVCTASACKATNR
jgi:undecaprenyl diphosphate synthase